MLRLGNRARELAGDPTLSREERTRIMNTTPDRHGGIALSDFRSARSPTDLESSPPTGDSRSAIADTRGRAAPSVLLLLDYHSAFSVALQRAVDVTERLGGDLLVALGMPDEIEERHPALVASHITDLLEQLSSRRNFRVEVVHGTVHDLGIEMMHAITPALVVVDASLGGEACWMVDALRIPVLVARNLRPRGQLVGATDMLLQT